MDRNSKVTCQDMDDVINSLLDNADDGLRPSESLLRLIPEPAP